MKATPHVRVAPPVKANPRVASSTPVEATPNERRLIDVDEVRAPVRAEGYTREEVPAPLTAALAAVSRVLADLRAEGAPEAELARAVAAVVAVQVRIEARLGLTPRPSPRPRGSERGVAATQAPAPVVGGLTDQLLLCLREFPGASAKELTVSVRRLAGYPVTRSEVNAVLYRGARFVNDGGAAPRWRIR